MIGEIGGDAEEEAAEYVQEPHDQAGGRLHRRGDGACRQAHGACRRDHLRRQGKRGGEDGDPRECGIKVAMSPAEMGKTLVAAVHEQEDAFGHLNVG